MHTQRKILLVFWALLILTVLALWLLYPQHFTPQGIHSFLQAHQQSLLFLYIGMSLVRGLFLLPSTPFVLAGVLIFPEQPLLVLLISMCGIWTSAAMAYFFSDFLGLDEMAEGKHQVRYQRLRQRMEQYGMWVVAAWAFFPAVPTDLICYAAGAMRMHFGKFMLGVTLGEVPLVCLYIWTGSGIGALLGIS